MARVHDMSSVFQRGHDLPRATRARGCWITNAEGSQYLDAASGALVVNVGHGEQRVTEAIRRQMTSVSYVHASAFTSDVVEQYGATLAERLPMSDASIFPVSGGSEAVETALKVARAYHLANDQADRTIVIGRDLSYHGNTRGALDVSGRQALRAPYLPWLSHSGRVPGVLEYRCPNPAHPDRCAHWHAGALQQEIARLGPERVAAFIAEPVGGAASGAAVPPDGYWEAIAEVCATHGVLIIADEVMTGFGRTGRWFAAEHFGLRPDIVTMAKGAASGYWPLGICALSGKVTAALDEGLIHGFTFSHHLVGAAAGLAVLRVIDEMGLVGQADERGRALRRALDAEIGSHPAVGDIRGIGLMLAIELVADKGSKRPFPRSAGMAERLTSLAKQEELLVYPSTGSAGDGTGDLIMIGPPLTIEMDEIDQLVTRLARALERLR